MINWYAGSYPTSLLTGTIGQIGLPQAPPGVGKTPRNLAELEAQFVAVQPS